MQPAPPEPVTTVRWRYHLRHFPGLLYILVTLLLAIGAVNAQNNLLYWAFGFALAVLFVSGVVSGAMLTGLTIEREPIPPAVAGAPLLIRYRVHNRNRLFPAFALRIAEQPEPRRIPNPKSPIQNPESPDDWPHHLTPIRAFVAHVGPGQTVTCEAPVLATRRGVAVLTTYRLTTTFPFGLVRKSVECSHRRTVIIRPRIQPPQDPDIVAATRGQSRGVARPAPRSGAGEEFFALREYVPGDSLRAVAWKSSARTTQLHVRQNAALLPDRLWIGVDLSPSAPGECIEAALSLAAGLIDAAARRELEVGLVIPSAGVHIAPRAGPVPRERLMDELALARLSTVPSPVRTTDRIIVVGSSSTNRSLWPGHSIQLEPVAPGPTGNAP